jgi:very-short-patch-repair endonuclease
MCGVRFHRRKAVLHYVAHFYCPRARLAIFIDQNSKPARDGHLRSRGILSLYLTTAELRDHSVHVQAAIFETVKQRL